MTASRPSVLMVDDESGIRDYLDVLLRAWGCDVIAADEPARGLELWMQRRPDLAVLDVELGEGCGIALAQRILAVEPGARLIFYSGCDDPEVMTAARRAGAVVRKSTSVDELEAAVRSAAPRE